MKKRRYVRRITDSQRNATEEAHLHSRPQYNLHMSPEDLVRFQQAIEIATSGKRQQAHARFCFLHNHGHAQNVTLLFWLARTTPFLVEAQRMLATIEHLDSTHPDLPALRRFVRRWERKNAPPADNGPAPSCLIAIVIILAITLLTGLFVPRPSTTTPATPTDTPYYYSTQTDNSSYPSYPSYPSGSGYTVECRDGTYSHSGGKRGACSYHGGENRP